MNTEHITKEWLSNEMKKLGLSPESLAKEINVTPSDIYNYLSGLKPLSGRTKTLLHYFFSYLELRKELKK